MITYILTVLILMAEPTPVAVSVTAEFNTLDACWKGNSKVIDPLKNVHPDAETFSSCSFKGWENVGG